MPYPKKPAATLTGSRAFVYRVTDPASVLSCLGCGAEDHGAFYGVPAPEQFNRLEHGNECLYAGWPGGFETW